LKQQPRLLIIESNSVSAKLLSDYFSGKNFTVDTLPRAQTSFEALEALPYDLVLAATNIEDMPGLTILQQIKSKYPDLDVILMTDDRDLNHALQALDAGVYDYLMKPFQAMDDVLRKVERAIERRRILVENKRLMQYLKHANQQIEHMNQELEVQVEDRTKQLATMNAKLEQLTITDDVTGLFNQRFLYSRLEEEFRRAQRHGLCLSVLMLDIDQFKAVNDNHDHIYGSLVLKHLGELFTRLVRRIDMVIRYGGDEFAILMPYTTSPEAKSVAERIRATVANSDVGESTAPYRVTVSIGVAELSLSQVNTPQELLQLADRALYAAKSAGRNQVVLSDVSRSMAVVA